jgi:hypothetical protein
MGTAREWMQALFWGEAWAAFMVLWSVCERHFRNRKPRWSVEEALSLALIGVWFGAVTTFRWRAFHAPIAFVAVSAFAAA